MNRHMNAQARRNRDGCAATIASLLLIVPLGLLSGNVVSDGWRWFVVPLGLPEIGVLHAWGLTALVGLMAKDLDGEASATFWGVVGRLAERAFLLLLAWGLLAFIAMGLPS